MGWGSPGCDSLLAMASPSSLGRGVGGLLALKSLQFRDQKMKQELLARRRASLDRQLHSQFSAQFVRLQSLRGSQYPLSPGPACWRQICAGFLHCAEEETACPTSVACLYLEIAGGAWEGGEPQDARSSIIWEKQVGVMAEGFKVARWRWFLSGRGGWLEAPWVTRPGCGTSTRHSGGEAVGTPVGRA